MTVTRPPLTYFGGKWRIADWVISHFPTHQVYVEPFGGGASVLLKKPKSKLEVYNDAAGSVVNFFRVVRDHGDELTRRLTLTPYALDEYKACAEPSDDPIEQARRFFVMANQCFGARGADGQTKKGWRRAKECNHKVALIFTKRVDVLAEATNRLRTVQIDNLDYVDVLAKYDSTAALFFVDPPYVHESRSGYSGPTEGYGEHEMSDSDHVALIERLAELRGAVVLSGYQSDLYMSHVPSEWVLVTKATVTAQQKSATECLWLSRPPQLTLGL